MTPLILVTGFLGAGKTTWLRHIFLDASAHNLNIAVIINEFGAVDVDGELLRDRAQNLASIAGGCACCSGQDDFVEAVRNFGDGGFDAIIVEASGLADPLILLETLAAPALLKIARVNQIVCVADASNWNQSAGALGPLMRRQLMLADTIILNKIDLIGDAAAEALTTKIAAFNRSARVQTAIEGVAAWNWNSIARADVNRALLGDLRAESNRALLDDSHTESPVNSHAQSHTIYVALPHPLERAALERALAELGENVWRAKGFVRVRSEQNLQLVQLSGGPDGNRVRIAPFALPFGAAEPQLGLVFIGAAFDAAHIKRTFDALSLTF